jgi:hypothetical protein
MSIEISEEDKNNTGMCERRVNMGGSGKRVCKCKKEGQKEVNAPKGIPPSSKWM